MKLAFYKAACGTTWDKAIGWWTHGPYSHVELVFDGMIPLPPHIQAGDPIPPAQLCFSSSPRDGGVRFKWIDLDDGKWDLVDVPGDEIAALKIAQTQVGLKYDWLGIAGFVLPFGEHDDGDRFCSEVCVQVLRGINDFPGTTPWKTSPNGLHQLVEEKATERKAA